MSSLLLAGWLLAIGAAVLLLLARRAAARATERVVRACHELRGPLQNVMLALGADEDGPHPSVGALAVELARATRAVEDLAAATAGRPARDEVRRIALTPLVRDVVAVHDVVARTRDRRVVLVTPDVDATVLGDRGRLAQAIGNLVRNAVEHGAPTACTSRSRTRATACASRSTAWSTDHAGGAGAGACGSSRTRSRPTAGACGPRPPRRARG